MKTKLIIFAVLIINAFAFLYYEETVERYEAFSIGCEDHLSGDLCHGLAKKYIHDEPTWGIYLGRLARID